MVQLSDEIRLNLLTSAIEGGSNCWYLFDEDACEIIDAIKPPDKKTPFVERLWAALEAGAKVPVTDIEEEEGLLGYLSKASLDKAEKLMADKHPHHFADAVSENDDAITGDVFFQLAVMGEIVYG